MSPPSASPDDDSNNNSNKLTSPSLSKRENSETESNDDDKIISQYPPELIHRILLTDGHKRPQLTYNDQPRPTSSYHFHNFLADNGLYPPITPQTLQNLSLNSRIELTMRQAYFHMIRDDILTRRQNNNGDEISPLHPSLVALNQSLRNLVPNRTDLHDSILPSNDAIERTTSLLSYLPLLVRAAEALLQLTAPDRAAVVQEWIDQSRRYPSSHDDYELDDVVWMAASVAYLSVQVGYCADDVRNFKLRVVGAPSVMRRGVMLERRILEMRYGKELGDTKEWVKRILELRMEEAEEGGETTSVLSLTKEERVALVKQLGFVNDILFSKPTTSNDTTTATTQKPKIMPEVLRMDIPTIHHVRNMVRLSVMGSALALTVCHCTGNSDELLRSDPSRSGLTQERTNLITAMAKGTRVEGELTKEIEEAVLGLARTISSNPLDTSTTSTILHRARAILKNEDPVMKLLDNRVRGFFLTTIIIRGDDEIASSTNNNGHPRHPTTMRTGRALSTASTTAAGSDDIPAEIEAFLTVAKEEARSRGFSFYADELASACHEVRKVVCLMVDAHWEVIEGFFSSEN